LAEHLEIWDEGRRRPIGQGALNLNELPENTPIAPGKLHMLNMAT
jgi:hypothetical protein